MNNLNHQLKATSSLAQWLSYLENSHTKTIDLGLKRIKKVAQSLDLLTPAPYVITVGGTNGKGTTCRLLEMILINAGFRVGVYSSPHLLRYNERVRIQNQELEDDQHTTSFAFIEENRTESLTYFEFSTLSALHLFKRAKLDVVILEVGLGGRLDATNIVDSDLAVITSIDIDHTDFLGSTREEIGFEKAGIFRANKPVIIGEPVIPQSMLMFAQTLNCALSCRERDWSFSVGDKTWQWRGQKVRLENLPFCKIPLQNAATALAAVEQLPFDISPDVIRNSLQQVELNGRFQLIKSAQLISLAKKLNKPIADFPKIIIDVGHNPHAAHYLSAKLTALKETTSGRLIAVCGILKDKDAEGIISPLLSVVDKWHCVTLNGSRGRSGHELALLLRQLAPAADSVSEDSVSQGIFSALKTASNQDVVILFGSFHTVGAFLEILTHG